MTSETNQPQSPFAESLGNPKPNFDLVVARHAEYYDMAYENGMFAKAEDLPQVEKDAVEDEAKSKIGHLTENGKAQAQKLGLDVLSEALASGDPVDITFISSAQEYESPRFPDAPWAGRRAEETTFYALNAIMGELQRKIVAGEINNDRVRLSTPAPKQAYAQESKPNKRLVERDVYWSPISTPLSLVDVYRERAQEVIDKESQSGQPLTSGYDTQVNQTGPDLTHLSNREKELWARGDSEIDEFASKIGNETSTDVSGRIMEVISDLNELAEIHAQHEPDRKLLVVLVAHDANIGALSHKGFGVEKPVIPTFTGRLNIHVSEGEARLEYDGNSYNTKLPE